MEPIDQLAAVRAELPCRNAKKVAADTGLHYDTLMRIKHGEGTPAYDKVLTLYRYLFRQPDAAHGDKPAKAAA